MCCRCRLYAKAIDCLRIRYTAERVACTLRIYRLIRGLSRSRVSPDMVRLTCQKGLESAKPQPIRPYSRAQAFAIGVLFDILAII